MLADIHFFPEKCLKSKHRASHCSLCYDVCPSSALDFVGPILRFDALKCMACGACVAVCPTDVFESSESPDAWIREVIAHKEKEDEVVFTCKKANALPHAIILPCLARLNASLLLACCASKARVVRLLHATCEQCPMQKSLSKVLLEAIALVQKLSPHTHIQHANFHSHLITEEKKIAGITQSGHLKRRMFLALLGRKSSHKEYEVQTSHTPKRALYHRATEMSFKKHAFFMAHLKRLQPLNHSLILGLKPLINPLTCKACSICTNVCPTGALAFSEKVSFEIYFKADRCIGCHLCADVCFAKAISFTHKTVYDVLKTSPTTLLKRERESEDKCVAIYMT